MEAISYFCGRLLVVVVVVVKQAWQAEVLTPILQAVISKSIHSPIRTVPLSLSPSLYIHTHSHGYFKKYPLTCKKYMQPTYLRSLFPFHSLIYWPTLVIMSGEVSSCFDLFGIASDLIVFYYLYVYFRPNFY